MGATPATALLVAVAYFLGAKLGLALTFAPQPVSTVWPPNAILLAGLLLTPPRAWWLVLAATFPAHLAVELGGGVPVPMVLCWFVSNSSEALIGAACVRRLTRAPLRFDGVRATLVFVLGAGVLAAFLSSFLDAGFVVLNRWGRSGYWDVWRLRFLSNLVATLTIVPVIVTAWHGGLAALRGASLRRVVEAAVLAVATVAVSLAVFATADTGPSAAPHVLYAPLPLLLWAAIRFGPGGTSASILAVGIVSIWSAVHGLGPFAGGAPEEEALALQLFLIVTGVPLLLLASVIEERGRAEDAVRRSEDRLQQALDSADAGTWELRAADDVVVLGARAAEIIGLTAPEPGIRTGRVFDAVHPDDRAALARAVRAALATGERLRIEFRVVHPNGDVRWIFARGNVASAGERDRRIIGLFGDRTARKRVELALRESEQRMALAATAVDLGFWGMDLGTNESWVSDHFVRIYGLEPGDDASPTACIDLVHPEDRQRVLDALTLAITTRAPYDEKYRVVRPDGSVRWIESSARIHPTPTGESEQVVGVIIDTTTRHLAEVEAREQQRQMAHLARVAVVGELSGTIAHELNQPLAAILTNAQVAVRMLAGGTLDLPELRAILGDIVDDDKRAGAVIRRIRGLLRNDDLAMEPICLADLVADVVDIAHGELLEHGVTLRLEVDHALPAVRCDRVQLQQVLLNLIVNACDAMVGIPPTERRLTVAGCAAPVGAAPGGSVRLSITDSGPGISVSPVDRVFDPFVSSKTGGLGLGLTICRSIVTAHGGQIRAESPPGSGATFHIDLPSVLDPAPTAAEPALGPLAEVPDWPVPNGGPPRG